jgi:hypothetical protein
MADYQCDHDHRDHGAKRCVDEIVDDKLPESNQPSDEGQLAY